MNNNFYRKKNINTRSITHQHIHTFLHDYSTQKYLEIEYNKLRIVWNRYVHTRLSFYSVDCKWTCSKSLARIIDFDLMSSKEPCWNWDNPENIWYFFFNFEQLSDFSMNFPNNVTLVQINCFEENPSTNAFRSQKRTQMFIPSVSRFRFALCRVSLYDQGWKFIKIHLTITFFYGRIPSSAVSGMCRSLS